MRIGGEAPQRRTPFSKPVSKPSHDHSRVAGEILELKLVPEGVWIRARVTDPVARRMGGFSIGGHVDDYSVINEDRSDF
jgi:hypothetical protein